MSLDLESLNKEQLGPVLDTEGAVLVTAGAGSGKTRLLTYRIANIVINKNVAPYNILAITFTNKAANEMKERLYTMLPFSRGLWVSTIHSLCVMILRSYIHLLGYSSNFSIYDEDERRKVIKKVAAAIDKNSDSLSDKIASALSAIKNAGMDIDDYIQIHKFLPDIKKIEQGMYDYQKQMQTSNALDFDDLLVVAYKVVLQFGEAREYYQNRFKYIHVDEFQDTNLIQYNLIKLLAGKCGNIFVVGDEDQSIYGWRGANIENIQNFTKDFDCRVYKLTQNYRSTKNIINLANSVIKNNVSRIEKELWTDNGEGERPNLLNPVTDSEEADFVMQAIKGLHARGESYKDMAVLMRINSLSRSIEQKFMFYGIPYRLYGGFKFYDRREIKDVLAYLKLLSNPYDNEAAARVLSFPKKGIGETSIEKLQEAALKFGVSLTQIIMVYDGNNLPGEDKASETARAAALSLPPPLINKLRPLAEKLRILKQNKNQKVSLLLKLLYEQLNLDEVFNDGTEDGETRKLNVRELVNSVMQTEANNPDLGLDSYVQQIMLYSDLDDDMAGDCVNVATIHSAKGLEFNTVFLIGLEEGIFPLSRTLDTPSELEEERRLMYVGLTRAKNKLYLSHARTRFMYGKYANSTPSRFLAETGLVSPFKKYDSYEQPYERDYGQNNYSQNKGQNKYNQARSGYSSASDKRLATTIPTNLPVSSVDIKSLKVGQRIKHKRLGEGTVKAVDTASNQADISFDSIGIVTLAIAFAPITIIEN